MPASAVTDLERAIDRLWAGVRLWSGLYSAPAFVALRETCERRYPGAGGPQYLNYTLSQAVSALGFRTDDQAPDGVRRVTPAQAAVALDAAFRQTTARRTHLAPLDYAGELPSMGFGRARIRRFAAGELDDFIRSHAPMRYAPAGKFETERLAQFTWLVVEEDIALAAEVGARSLPMLFEGWASDLGRIQPHKQRFPAVVEDALFALLTLPWEAVVEAREADWRPFGVPWVISLDDDLFAGATTIPSADTLSWGIRALTDHEGETVEVLEPLTTEIEAGQEGRITLDEDRWRRIGRARASPLFHPPIAHFIVRGLLAEGIDEFLAHIVSLEAGLGSEADHKNRKKLADGSNPGPNQRVGIRLANLLGDPFALWNYLHLFGMRNAYVHGRPMPDVPRPARLEARALARAALWRLIEIASGDEGPPERDAFLAALLEPRR